MRQRERELAQLGIQVGVVTFDNIPLATAYVRSTNLQWPLLLDSQRTLYAKYGMTRGSWWNIYGASSIWKYLKLIASGRRPGTPGSDWRQLGGDVLIDPQGIVRLHHVSSSPHDRPSIDALLTLVRENQDCSLA